MLSRTGKGRTWISLCSWETLPAMRSAGAVAMLCSHCSEPAPGTHRGDFLREKEKGSRQGRNSWMAGTPLPGWSSPPGSPGRQLSVTRGKRAFAASPGAMEGIHCSCPNQASLPNKAETGEATGASARFVCAGRIPTSIWPARGPSKPSQGHPKLPAAGVDGPVTQNHPGPFKKSNMNEFFGVLSSALTTVPSKYSTQ